MALRALQLQRSNRDGIGLARRDDYTETKQRRNRTLKKPKYAVAVTLLCVTARSAPVPAAPQNLRSQRQHRLPTPATSRATAHATTSDGMTPTPAAFCATELGKAQTCCSDDCLRRRDLDAYPVVDARLAAFAD